MVRRIFGHRVHERVRFSEDLGRMVLQGQPLLGPLPCRDIPHEGAERKDPSPLQGW